MANRRKTEGEKLRVSLDEALAEAREDTKRNLVWTKQELVTINRACHTADRAEVLRARFDALAADPMTPASLLNQLSAELRLLDRQVVDLVGQVSPDPGPQKSAAHQRAANYRWSKSV